MTRIAMRGYRDGVLMFEEAHDADTVDLEKLAESHALQLAGDQRSTHLIEVEFLDEPDVNQRFFRFGTDPQPVAIVGPGGKIGTDPSVH